MKARNLTGVTKKDFIAIADVLCNTNAPERTARGLSSYFKSQNPAFDEGRFLRAVAACRR